MLVAHGFQIGLQTPWFSQYFLCNLRRMARSVSGIGSGGEPTGRRRREVLRLLRSSPDPMSIVAIAERLGVHPNTVRFHLDSLLADGQVEQVDHGRKGP